MKLIYDCPGFATINQDNDTQETLYSADRPALLAQNKPRNLTQKPTTVYIVLLLEAFLHFTVNVMFKHVHVKKTASLMLCSNIYM